MSGSDDLTLVIDATLTSLEGRCDRLRSGSPPDAHAHTDALVAAAARHLAATHAVLVPLAAEQLGDEDGLVEDYRETARRLERGLVRLKGRAYGESHSAHESWPEVCTDVRDRLEQHDAAERRLADRLAAEVPTERLTEMAEQLFRAEVKAPTRPHPYLPHTGRPGGAARRAAAVVDRFWDTAQGRVVPPVIAPRKHLHDSLLAQYLCADPHFDGTASMIAHPRQPGADAAAPAVD